MAKISAKKLIKELTSDYYRYNDETNINEYIRGYNQANDNAVLLIKAMESELKAKKKKTDKKVKHGKWIWDINSKGYYQYCSCCKEKPQSGVITKHCPNCGAKMDLKE